MKALGFEAPRWLGRSFPFTVLPPLKVWADSFAAGKLPLVKGHHTGPVTFQDSCNFIRNAGFFEESRLLMRHVCTDLREMHPNGNLTYCCGNGGGQGLMPEYKKQKLAALRAKAECIRATGAELVVVACHNCEDGITECVKTYEVAAQVELFSGFLAGCIDLSGHTAQD